MTAAVDLIAVSLRSILPVLGLAGVGYLLGRRGLDVAPLNTITVYVLAPALVFHTLVTTELGGAVVAKLTVGVVAYTVGMTLLAAAVARSAGIGEPVFGAVVLAATYPNCGNYGIPVSEFAFGPVGRSTAVLFLAVQSIVIYTLGAYTAARSGRAAQEGDEVTGSGTGPGSADPAGVLADVRRVLKLPLVYAVITAGLVRWLGVVPPVDGTLMRTIELTGEAAIPVLQLVLGASLAGLATAVGPGRVAIPSALKLAVAPVLAVGIALAVDFGQPTVARVFVLEAAMPAAITPIVLVGEFGDAGTQGYLGTVILVTTVLSVPALTALIAVLHAGVVV